MGTQLGFGGPGGGGGCQGKGYIGAQASVSTARHKGSVTYRQGLSGCCSHGHGEEQEEMGLRAVWEMRLVEPAGQAAGQHRQEDS